MNSVTICVIVIVIITVAILYVYYQQESQHQYQLAKIRALEYKYDLKYRELEALKARSQACSVPNLNDPRSCYFGSNYTCAWNDLIGRCDSL